MCSVAARQYRTICCSSGLHAYSPLEQAIDLAYAISASNNALECSAIVIVDDRTGP